MSNKIIEVLDLEYKYAEMKVLESVNITVDKQDYVGIIGPNGGGKTTLIKLILGLLKPTKGAVVIDEEILLDKKISYVNQQVYSHYKNFPISVFEVVRMGLYASKGILKFYNKSDNAKVLEMLEALDIMHLKDSLITNLSGGERQRALLGRSLINQPEILILDEPTSALDPAFREEFYELISKINASGVTILLVSHDLGVLENYVSKLLYLDKTVEYYGDVADYFKSETYKERHGEIR